MSKKGAQPNGPRDEVRPQSLWLQREALMREIALRERSGPLPPMFAKARTFLVHFWAKASWAGRAEILVTARWLVNLGAVKTVLPLPTSARRAKRTTPVARRLPRGRPAEA